MAIVTLQSRGLLFILLLAGNEITTVGARRTRAGHALDIAQMAQEPITTTTTTKEDSPVPTSSSECRMVKAKCQPAKYCYFGRRWSNLGGVLRDKSCHLKALYKSDEKLAKKFGIASGQLILKSEEFRTSGSIWQLGKLKHYYQDIGTCANAASSDKTSLIRLMTAFGDKQIEEYATSVGEMVLQIPGLKVFNTDGLSEEALSANALDRTIQSLDLGFQKSRLLRTLSTKFNLMELMKVKALDENADQATIAAVMKKALPILSRQQLDMALSETKAKNDAELQECNNDDKCMKGRTEARIEAISEKLSEEEDENINALLQYAQSKGLTQAKQDEDHHDRRNRAFSFLEEHMESVEGEPSEHVEGEPSEHWKERWKNEWSMSKHHDTRLTCFAEAAGFLFLALVFLTIAVLFPFLVELMVGIFLVAWFPTLVSSVFGISAVIVGVPSLYSMQECVSALKYSSPPQVLDFVAPPSP